MLHTVDCHWQELQLAHHGLVPDIGTQLKIAKNIIKYHDELQ